MKTCVRYELGALDARDPQAVAALQAHADVCPDCAATRARWGSYDALVSRARAAAAAQEDLTPEAWVRIRERIDARAERRGRWGLVWPLGLAAAAALAVAMVWLRPAEGGPDLPVTADRIAADGAARQTPRPPAKVAAAVAPADPIYAAGTRIDAADEALTLVAFGRHILTLGPRASMKVVSWADDAMVLEVLRGSLECDVARASAEELFEVRSGPTRVRVLGTRFTVVAQRDGATGVEVSHGMVEVTHPAGTAHLVAGQSERFSGALVGEAEAQRLEADQGSDAASTRAGEPRGRRGDATKLIDIKVPDQRMDAPAAPKPAEPRHRRRGDGMKLIEIVVPPQTAPGP